MIRLMALLGLLGVAFYGVMALRLPDPPARAPVAATLPAPAQAARADTSPGTLAPSVRRLAEQPVTGPVRPVVLQDAVIDPAAVQPMSQPARAAPAPPRLAGQDIRSVSADSANVRGGPSTGHAVVGRITRGEEVEVMETDPSGWLRIRIQGDGIEGWVAGRLLAK